MQKFDSTTNKTYDDVDIDDNLHETTLHGDFEYPIGQYHLTLSQMYLHNIRWHWHGELELSIVRSGSADFMTDGNSIRVTTGQALLFNQNVLHSVHSIEGTDCVIDNLLFSPTLIFGYGQTSLASKYLTPLVCAPSLKMVLIDGNDPEQASLYQTAEKLISLNIEKPFGYELQTKGLLCCFWLTLLEKFLNTSSDAPSMELPLSPDEVRIKQALLYIAKHYSEPISLDDIADSIHVSKSECCRCFKRMLHLSPFEYLMKYRIYESTRKLLNPEFNVKSMSSLALSVGFNNASYYNKLFKRYLDCTPSEYRDRTLHITAEVANYHSLDL